MEEVEKGKKKLTGEGMKELRFLKSKASCYTMEGLKGDEIASQSKAGQGRAGQGRAGQGRAERQEHTLLRCSQVRAAGNLFNKR